MWTGAIIAFQLKGTSAQLSGAFSLLAYAFIAPLVALLFQGTTLRIIATLATLTFGGLMVRQVILYLVVTRVGAKTAAENSNRELFATDLGRRLLTGIGGYFIFPTGYAGACMIATALAAFFATEYAVATTSVGALCFGLYYILVALKDEKSPRTPAQRATVRKALNDMVEMFQKRAASQTQAPATEGGPSVGSHDASSPASASNSGPESSEPGVPRDIDKPSAEDLKEVAAFLAPLSAETLRPGILTQAQLDKARSLLPFMMSKAVNDKETFDATLALSQILAAASPDE